MEQHKHFEYGYSFVSRDKETGEEKIIATFGTGIAGRHTAIGYAQGYLDMSGLNVSSTTLPKKEGWRWWDKWTEWMVVDRRGKVVTV